MVDPLPYMTYQPFLPEVAAGSLDPRHALVNHRRHLKRTKVITAKVTDIRPRREDGDHHARGRRAVGRRLRHRRRDGRRGHAHVPDPRSRRPGDRPQEHRRGRLDPRPDDGQLRQGIQPARRPRARPPAHRRRRRRRLRRHRDLRRAAQLRQRPASASTTSSTTDDTHFHLIEAMDLIMPEVSRKTSRWVIRNLEQRAANVHLNTQLASAVDGKIEMSNGETFESDLIVWTAGVMANPVLRSTDLPIEERGRLRVQADLRVVNDDGVVARRLGRRRRLRRARPHRGPGRRRVHRAERPARRAPGQAHGAQPHRRAARRGAAPVPPPQPGRRRRLRPVRGRVPERRRSRSRDSSPGSCTAATTASRCRCGSARSASSASGSSTS